MGGKVYHPANGKSSEFDWHPMTGREKKITDLQGQPSGMMEVFDFSHQDHKIIDMLCFSSRISGIMNSVFALRHHAHHSIPLQDRENLRAYLV